MTQLEQVPGHVHLLMEVPQAVAPPDLAQKLKGRSWWQLRQEFPHLRRLPALWSPSWFVSTASGAPPEIVRRYAGTQKLAR